VVEEQSSATEPSGLLAELESADEGWAGRVTLIRIGSTGIAYVWIPALRRTFRVLAPKVAPDVAAGMLALRVVELLSLDPGPREQPRKDVVDAPPPPPHQPLGERDDSLLVGIGAGFGAGLRAPSTRVLLAFEAELPPPFRVALSGAASVAPAALALDDGSAKLHEQDLGLHLMLSTARGQGFSAAGGLGLSLQCLQIVPTAADGLNARPQDACGALASARLRAGHAWSALRLWAMLEPGLSVPKVRLLRDDETIATLGLWMTTSLGLEWQL
jgi:hypothetical protein